MKAFSCFHCVSNDTHPCYQGAVAEIVLKKNFTCFSTQLSKKSDENTILVSIAFVENYWNKKR